MRDLQHDQPQLWWGLWGHHSTAAHLLHVVPASSREQINQFLKKFQSAGTEQAKTCKKDTEKQMVSWDSC